MTVFRSWSLILLVVGVLLGWLLFSSEKNPDGKHFKFGLDLVGGSHLVYEADTSTLEGGDVEEAMNALRDVIETRVNLFGVAEPLVQVEKASALATGGAPQRLIVELPGITDLEKAIAMIGATPQLEFKLVEAPLGTSTESTYAETGLTGKYLKKAHLEFSGSQNTMGGFVNEPLVMVDFNDEGKELFANITKSNIGKQLAIFLDGRLISEPVIREEIRGGTAVISGGFKADEAKELVRNLNLGALPVPISLASTQTIGATLGTEILDKGIKAGLVGFALVVIFMIVWYRLPGFLAGLALTLYVIFMLAVFKFIPVTITAAGIAGFLLSIGMAVDANVLIFERFKEEYENGKGYVDSVKEGFARAWYAIRDGNFTSLISAIVLFWFGTSIVQGFALVYGIGIALSMFTAITLTRTFMLGISGLEEKAPALLKSGFLGTKKEE